VGGRKRRLKDPWPRGKKGADEGLFGRSTRKDRGRTSDGRLERHRPQTKKKGKQGKKHTSGVKITFLLGEPVSAGGIRTPKRKESRSQNCYRGFVRSRRRSGGLGRKVTGAFYIGAENGVAAEKAAGRLLYLAEMCLREERGDTTEGAVGQTKG